MSENKIMQQVTAIFMIFMVFFYIGAGIFIIWYFEMSTLDKPIRVIIGSAFLFLGIYRAFRAYEKIKEAFFTNREKDKDRDKYHIKGHINRQQ